jgi:hypothetical protein
MSDTSFEPTEEEFDQIYGSRFLSAGHIIAKGGKLRAKIAKVEMVDVRQDSGTRRRIALYLQGVDKPLIVNQTNACVLRDGLGKNPSRWRGAELGVYTEQVAYQGKRVPGLRLKVLRPPAPAAAAPAPVPVKPAPAEVEPEINNDPAWAPDPNWEPVNDVVAAE